jgi:hypothetical protein
MDAASVAAFARQAAAQMQSAFGTTVTFGEAWNGAPRSFTCAVSTGTPELNLESGGFQQPVDYVVRVPKTDMPHPPEVKSAVKIAGKNYRVISVRLNYSPLAQEWIVEVGNP